jgi:hypothetical protein
VRQIVCHRRIGSSTLSHSNIRLEQGASPTAAATGGNLLEPGAILR